MTQRIVDRRSAIVHRPAAPKRVSAKAGRSSGSPRFFQGFAQSQLQFAGGFFRERDGDDFANFGAAGFDDADDSAHQLGRLAGAGRGLDDQRVVQARLDGVAIFLIGKLHAHGRLLKSRRSAICCFDLRAARRSWSGPHTVRKSQYRHARSAGAGGSMPCSIARSIISITSMPSRLAFSLIGTTWSVNPPAVVQYEKRALSTLRPVADSTARL